MTFITAVLSC